MEHLPTWSLALVLGPMLVVAVARYHGRSARPLELLSVLAVAVAAVVAVVWFPAEAWGIVAIGLPVGIFFAVCILLCAGLEALMSKISVALSARGPSRRTRPQPVKPARVATGAWASSSS